MKIVKQKDIERNWHLIDAKSKTLGRISTEISMHLMGKNKPTYSANFDTGDYVVVINSKEVKFSGKKETQKKYFRHSGYPGGLYSRSVSDVRKLKPNDLIRDAVIGMLPKTKMGKMMLKKLYIFMDAQNPYQSKFK